MSERDVIAILDTSYGKVRVFREGLEAQEVGGHGLGPGEFVDPLAMAFDAEGRLLVADRRRTVHRFSPGTEGFVFLDRVQLDFSPLDICSNLEGLIAHSPLLGTAAEGGLTALDGNAHVLDDRGAVVRSLSRAYLDDNLLLRNRFGQGRIACIPGSSDLWVAYQLLGEIHRLGPSGKIRAIIKFDDLTYPALVLVGNRLGPDPRGLSKIEVISNLSLAGDYLAVGIEARVFGQRGEVRRETYLFEQASSRLVWATNEYGLVGGGERGILLYRERPEPEVFLVEFPGKGH